MFPQFRLVRRSGITLVPPQLVLREDQVPLPHQSVPFHLGQNGSGGNRDAERVSFDDGNLGNREVQSQGVHQQKIGRRDQLQDGFSHGEAGSLVDVDPVNLGGVHASHGPGQRPAANLGCQFFPFLG